MIIAIDPGDQVSAFIIWDNNSDNPISEMGLESNLLLKERLKSTDKSMVYSLAIEMVASYGMPVGKTVFETCVWIGAFIEAWGGEYKFIYRKDVKMYLCNSMRAKDSNIRQALIDKFEPGLKPKERPKGILKGVSKDEWSAVAIAVYASEVKDGI
jgi:hypothetical protein